MYCDNCHDSNDYSAWEQGRDCLERPDEKMVEYPGKWNYYVAVPQGAGGRKSLIHTIVRDTKEYYWNGTKPPLYDPHRKH
jgi:hypothetical protein